MIKKIIAWFVSLAAGVAIVWYFAKSKIVTVTPDRIEKPDIPQDDSGTLTKAELEKILKDLKQ